MRLSCSHGLALVLATLAISACGFTGVAGREGAEAEPSTTTDGGNGADGSTPATEVFVEPPGCGPATCALPTVPAGWELVLFEDSRTTACPTGFDSSDAIESPVAGTTACSCAPCATTGTSCASGPIPTAYDTGGGGCGINGAQHQTNNGACYPQSGSFGQNARVDAPAAIRGTCTSQGVPVPGNIASDARLVCTRQASTCTTSLCGAPGAMRACVATTGDVACPASAATKHLLGADATLTCPSCGCSITSATCGGSLEFYPQSNCGGTPLSLPVGACKATSGASFSSTKWKPLVVAEKCTTTPNAPTVKLTAPRTICCP